jgi:two-component system CheB/CheR fusion protein
MPSPERICARVTAARQTSELLRARAEQMRAQAGVVQQSNRALRILIVEDHADTAEVLRKLRGPAGHDVVLAHTIHEAMERAHEAPFSRLLCDIGLPDGTGLDLVRIMKSECPGIRAIALSGYAMQQDIDQALQAGFDAHLAKPVSFEQLLTCVV